MQKKFGLSDETVARIEEAKKNRRIPKHEKLLCKKARCLKQINPHAEDPEVRKIYWDDLPFVRDDNLMACYLCDIGVVEV